MPPYTPVKSKAQARTLFALADEGQISEDEARGKTRAADWRRLPEHAPHHKTTLRDVHERAKKGHKR